MIIRLKHAMWFLYGSVALGVLFTLTGILYVQSGDSTTPKQDNIMRLLTPPSAEIR